MMSMELDMEMSVEGLVEWWNGKCEKFWSGRCCVLLWNAMRLTS